MNPHSNLDAVIGLAVLILAVLIFGTAVAIGEHRERRPRRRSIYAVQRQRAAYDALAENSPESDRGLRLRRRHARL